MKHYLILSAPDEDMLANDVEAALNDGWDLAGQMAIHYLKHLGATKYYQPIMKVTIDRPGVKRGQPIAGGGEKDDTGISSFGGVTEGEMPRQ